MSEFSYTDPGDDQLAVRLRDSETIEVRVNHDVVYLPISVAEKLSCFLSGLAVGVTVARKAEP